MDFKTALLVANVIIGLSLFGVQIRYFCKCRNKTSWSWIKLLYAFPGIYWAAIYVLIGTTSETVWRAELFSRYFVRGGITATLLIMLVGALFRAYHIRKVGG